MPCWAVSYQWTGSENSNVNEMVNAMSTAITGGADGIAVALVDNKAFNSPTDSAHQGGHPGRRLQRGRRQQQPVGLHRSGPVRVRSGDGQAHRRPRRAGQRRPVHRDAGLDQPPAAHRRRAVGAEGATARSRPSTVATGAAVPAELSAIDSYVTGHSDVKGLFAVDAGSTQSVAQVMQKHSLRGKGVKGGGYDITPTTQKLLAADQIDFTIDQQPYLQGFLPVLELYLYAVSKTLTGMADVNTGLKFLDKDDREALQHHEVALRGHLEGCRRLQGLIVRDDGRRYAATDRGAQGASGSEPACVDCSPCARAASSW